LQLNFISQNIDRLALTGIMAGFVAGVISVSVLIGYNILSLPLEKDDYRLLLTTSSTIIATILAVSFSISILGIQHALGNFAPSLLKHFISDKSTVISFAILSVSSVICLVGLILPWKELMASLTLYILPCSFLVLAYYFYARSRTTTSISLLAILKKHARDYISNNLEKRLENKIQEASKDRYLGKAMKKMNEGQIEIVTNTVFHTTDILGPIKDSITANTSKSSLK